MHPAANAATSMTIQSPPINRATPAPVTPQARVTSQRGYGRPVEERRAISAAASSRSMPSTSSSETRRSTAVRSA